MRDQASSLRSLASRGSPRPVPDLPEADFETLSVVSGKGGVGKSSLSLNLALALADLGERVCLFDADLGMADLDTLIGVTPSCGLEEVVRGEMSLEEVLYSVEENISLLPGFSGVAELINLSSSKLERVRRQLPTLNGRFDRMIFDCSAGASRAVVKMATSSDRTLLVTTPDPAALVDAYSLLKVVAEQRALKECCLAINMVRDDAEGERAANKLTAVSEKHIDTRLELIGKIPDDRHLREAGRRQEPLLRHRENSPAARRISEIARKLSGREPERDDRSFWQRLFSS